MFEFIKKPLYHLLRRSEKYTKTDMVHFFSANFWLNFSRIISVGTGILLTVAFANLLTPEQFGAYKYVIAAAGFIASFSMSGLSIALMKAVAQGKKHVVPSLVRSATLWSIPASIAALGVSTYYFSQSNNDLGFAFLFIALTNSVGSGIGITKGIWQASNDFKTGTLAGIPRILVPFAIILLTILFTKNVTLILLAYFASNIVTSWIGYRWIIRRLKINGSKEDVEETIKYGKQMTAIGFFQLVTAQIDQLLLWHFAPPAALAIYALALSPVNEAKGLVGNIFSVAFPKIANKTEEEIRRSVPLRFRQMLIICIVATVAFILLIPLLFTVLFPKYLSSVLICQVLALVILFQPRGIFDLVITLHGKMQSRFKAIVYSQIARLIFFLILIPPFGLWGAVAATLLSEATITLSFYLIYRSTRTIRSHTT